MFSNVRLVTNWPVPPQKMTRSLKFRIQEEEGLYHCNENKGDDLHLCFRIGKKCFSHDAVHIILGVNELVILLGSTYNIFKRHVVLKVN